MPSRGVVVEKTTPRFGARFHRDLASAETAWRKLEAEGRCSPFQRLDWVKTIAAHLADMPHDETFVVELFDSTGGHPMLLFPLIRRRRILHTVLTLPGIDVCDYCAPLFVPDAHWTPAEATAAWRVLRAVLPRADLLRIDSIPPLVSGAANPFMLLDQTHISAKTTCGLPLDGDPATVLERCCNPTFVKKLGKTGRRLAQRGAVRLIEARTEAEVTELFDTLLRQRLARFAELGRFDLLSLPHVVAFYRAAAMEGLNSGAVRLLGLRVGDAWAGTYYGLRHGTVFQGLIVTIADDSWKTCSPGLHVHAHVIRWVCKNGLTYFDMSVGPASYKDQIGGRRSALYALNCALTPWGALVLAAIRSWAHLKRGIRKRRRIHETLRALSTGVPKQIALIRSGLQNKPRGLADR